MAWLGMGKGGRDEGPAKNNNKKEHGTSAYAYERE